MEACLSCHVKCLKCAAQHRDERKGITTLRTWIKIFMKVNLAFIIPAVEEGIVISLFLAEEWASSHLEMVLRALPLLGHKTVTSILE